VPNFGDELNAWLWPKLLPAFFDADERELFLGIGSILFDDYPSRAQKIVFGSGYGGYTPPPRIDDTWTFYFVRGPRTAQALGLDGSLALGDAAMLLRLIPDELPLPSSLPSGVAYMPHWDSAASGTWEQLAVRAGMRYIDPRWPVERVIAAIGACELLVSEAMHGAIVADALRIPWIPFLPHPIHRFKWYDFAESLGLELRFAQSAQLTWVDALATRLVQYPLAERRARYYGHRMRHFGGAAYRWNAVRALRAAARTRPFLSDDRTIERVTQRMAAELERLRADYPGSVSGFARQPMTGGPQRSEDREGFTGGESTTRTAILGLPQACAPLEDDRAPA
jgi:exopolysaccharide glucosyl ketal-pyruvate-transferase